MEWQPIETAPKDGTQILVYEPEEKYTPIYVVVYDNGKWIEASGEQYANWKPTHWMPLPLPPKDL